MIERSRDISRLKWKDLILREWGDEEKIKTKKKKEKKHKIDIYCSEIIELTQPQIGNYQLPLTYSR